MRRFISFAEVVSGSSNVIDAPPRISIRSVSGKNSKRTAAARGRTSASRCIEKVCSPLPCPSLPKPSPWLGHAYCLQPASAGPGLSGAQFFPQPPADLLSVTSVARSVAVDNETGRVDEPFDFRSTLATCRYSTVPAAAAGTLRLLVACVRQTRSRARPCAHASYPCARCAAWHRRL